MFALPRINEKDESENLCLPNWSLDSWTTCSSLSALFTTVSAENDKSQRYYYWSVGLLQLCCLFRCPGLTLSSDSLMLFHYLSISLRVQPWGTFHLVYSKECNNASGCGYGTVCVLLCPCYLWMPVYHIWKHPFCISHLFHRHFSTSGRLVNTSSISLLFFYLYISFLILSALATYRSPHRTKLGTAKHPSKSGRLKIDDSEITHKATLLLMRQWVHRALQTFKPLVLY